MAEEKKFLERPLAVVGLLGGIAGLMATLVALYTGLVGPPGSAPPVAQPQATVPDQTQTRVAECMRTHGLTQASEKREVREGKWYFRACGWPAPTGAGADGFSEITVSSEPGPGKSEAEGMTELHVFTATCRDLEVGYLFDNQGTFVPEQPVRLTKGEARRVEGGSLLPAFQPGRDQFWVLSNARYALDTARCV